MCIRDRHESERYKLELLMNQAGLNVGSRAVEQQAHARSEATGGAPATAIEMCIRDRLTAGRCNGRIPLQT